MSLKSALLKMTHIIPDPLFLKLRYWAVFRKPLNLKDPKTYNEKLNWLKLYDRNPEYTHMVDKYECKKYIAERIGEEYVIPTLGVWDRFEDIDFDALPEQFVLKCTHDSGGLVICRNKAELDMEAARQKLTACLKRNYFWSNREWPYKNVKPRIIAESYMEDKKSGELRDYKFFCFHGAVKAMFVATERQMVGEEVKFDFYDADGNHLDLRQGHPNAANAPEIPETFTQMKELAEKLSDGLPQVRVDFYEVNGAIYFGELTFFHFTGMVPFEPDQWDLVWGEWIDLSALQEK